MTQNVKFCPGCGQPMQPDKKYCSWCGKILGEENQNIASVSVGNNSKQVRNNPANQPSRTIVENTANPYDANHSSTVASKESKKKNKTKLIVGIIATALVQLAIYIAYFYFYLENSDDDVYTDDHSYSYTYYEQEPTVIETEKRSETKSVSNETKPIVAAGNTFTVNGVSFVMKNVNGGTFKMGTDTETSWERPAHRVTVSDFAIGETEVTQGLWKAVMGNNPSRYQGDNLPVDNVSYNDIVNEFLPKLNQMTGQNFRLPTEAEWEFAARGGNNSNGYKYAGSNSLDNVAWYWKNTGDNYLRGTDDDWNWDNIVNNNGSTRNVKGKSPNELGIYGMSGNVWEWCSDEWHSYKSGSENNPKYQGNSKSSRVQRGGCWCSRTGDCRVTFRSGKKPEEHYPKWGFRIALSR